MRCFIYHRERHDAQLHAASSWDGIHLWTTPHGGCRAAPSTSGEVFGPSLAAGPQSWTLTKNIKSTCGLCSYKQQEKLPGHMFYRNPASEPQKCRETKAFLVVTLSLPPSKCLFLPRHVLEPHGQMRNVSSEHANRWGRGRGGGSNGATYMCLTTSLSKTNQPRARRAARPVN